MKKLVMTYGCTDECTYWFDINQPFEYESEEAALVDFEEALLRSIKKETGLHFANLELSTSHFCYFENRKLELRLPTIQTLGSWFEANKPRGI